MNISAIKDFAPAVRRQLIEAVTRKLDLVLSAQTPDYLSTFAPQVAALRKLAEEDRDGLIERVAYTWFNRFAALRYLDAKRWHPFQVRVITPAPDETQPEILKVTRTNALPKELFSHTNAARLSDLLDGRIPSSDPQGEVYRDLCLAACRYYHSLLPDVFEQLDDATELLLPDDLLTEHSVVQGFRTEITDDDCAEVELLGWLYQFYISEKKEAVMARKKAVPAEDIPAVTQLFTPHWIVRYLVENSLGRLWLLNHPQSKLRGHMPYYIDGDPETDFLRLSSPQEIRLLDPAVGSGHMLTYAFDLLTLIYEEEGYAPADIPALILQHNLYGLEICRRAAQLAELALVFKAREKFHRFFQAENIVRPNIIELRDVRFAGAELDDYFKAIGVDPKSFIPQTSAFPTLLHQFEEAKNFGSLIQPCLDEQAIATARRAIEAKEPRDELFLRETHFKVLRVIEQAEVLARQYDIVVENPPYSGSRYMNTAIALLAKTVFKKASADMFAMFILRSINLVKSGGHLAVVCPFVWMFIATYEAFRREMLSCGAFESMVRLEYNAFEPACVPVSAWLFRKTKGSHGKCTFIDLSDFKGIENQSPRTLEAVDDASVPYRFEADCSDFLKVPTAAFGYFVSAAFRDSFAANGKLGDVVDFTGSQNITGKNNRYVRLWWEIEVGTIGPSFRWIFYSKGGGNRKWWGLLEDVVDWSKEARGFYKQNKTSNLLDERYWFRPGVTYSMLTSNQATFRLLPAGAVYDKGGPAFHPDEKEMELPLLALCNSSYADRVFDILNPTLNLQVQDVKNLPLANFDHAPIVALANECVTLARADWDNFETSWDFCDQPLLRPDLKGATLEESWRNWGAKTTAAIRRMQELETENNRLFISAYGLDGELQPEVSEEQITLARADARRDMAAFLSYAVGCMMGRYSLDEPGLILANAGDTSSEYLARVKKSQDHLTFVPDEDGIIPVLDGEWFEDDIAARTRDFLRATFGEAALRENIRFIEESLGKDLRKYFMTEFYKDHLHTYKKRPIYWLVQSPKRGFSALLYLHRCNRDTMNVLLNRYLREYQVKLRNRIAHLSHAQTNESIRPSDKTAARKESDKFTKILRECEEWERQVILPLAQQRIELDLDDGVKVNYLKLGEALAPIPGLSAAED